MGSFHLCPAMLGSTRNNLARGILRQVQAKTRDVKTLATLSLAREAARTRSALVGLENGANSNVYRTIYTTRVLGDEVKVIVCPAFANSTTPPTHACRTH